MLCVGWIAGLVLPTCAAVFSDREIANSACIMVGQALSLYFSILYACLNICVFICIIILCAGIIHQVRKSSASVRSSSASDYQVIIRLGAVISTNFLATITVVFVSLFNPNVPASFETLASFITFPINSCLNPLINTLTTSPVLERFQFGECLQYGKNSMLFLLRLIKRRMKV